MRSLGKGLCVSGVLGGVGAVIWWYLFFEQILGESVKQASKCFYATPYACDLSKIMGVVGDYPTYSPWALYISVAVFSVGILLRFLLPKS